MKLTAFKNPLSGGTGNILSPSDWIQSILGVMFIIVVFATGQSLTKKVSERLPLVDSTIDPIISVPPSSSGIVKYTM